MEIIDVARIAFALVAVLGMIGLVAIAARKLGLQNGIAPTRQGKRLAIVETMALDQRRRAAIISCDGREHLLILDQTRITVIERAIPPREVAIGADPIAARASVEPLRTLHVPDAVVRFLQRAPRDQTMALRSAGVL
jgi:flagellar protein FliO/FliZ